MIGDLLRRALAAAARLPGRPLRRRVDRAGREHDEQHDRSDENRAERAVDEREAQLVRADLGGDGQRRRGLGRRPATRARYICGHVSSFVQSISGRWRCCASSSRMRSSPYSSCFSITASAIRSTAVLVGGDEVLRRHVCLPEDLRGECALVAVLEDRGDRVAAEVGAAPGPVHQLEADLLEAPHDAACASPPRSRRRTWRR